MNAFPHKDGSRFPGVLLGGLVAGALGLALAAGGTSASPDSNMNSPADKSSSSGQMAPGTAPHSSSGKYGSAMEGASSLPPNVTPGWKVRVCSERTKTDQIHFKFIPEGSKSSKSMGATGSSESKGVGGTGMAEHTASWTRGEATEINLPEELRDAEKIRVEATPSQKDKKASICLIYDDHVAKKLNFDDREVSTVKTTDNGECGC